MSAIEQVNASVAADSKHPSTPAEDASPPKRYTRDYAAHHDLNCVVPPSVQCIDPGEL